MRPTLIEPAWKPHISVVRREKPRKHLDIWELAIECGDLMDERTYLVESAYYLRSKADTIERELALTDHSKVKHIELAWKEIRDARRTAEKRDNALRRMRGRILPALERWRRLADKHGLPKGIGPNERALFRFDVNPGTNGRHWWFDVECELLHEIREVFGLRPSPHVRFHLTFAVREGCDESS
jgi:hypothetical protein